MAYTVIMFMLGVVIINNCLSFNSKDTNDLVDRLDLCQSLKCDDNSINKLNFFSDKITAYLSDMSNNLFSLIDNYKKQKEEYNQQVSYYKSILEDLNSCQNAISLDACILNIERQIIYSSYKEKQQKDDESYYFCKECITTYLKILPLSEFSSLEYINDEMFATGETNGRIYIRSTKSSEIIKVLITNSTSPIEKLIYVSDHENYLIS